MAAGDTKTIRLTAAYLTAGGSQAQFKAWQREAARLAREYLRTGREIHRIAFSRHLNGMLLRLRRIVLMTKEGNFREVLGEDPAGLRRDGRRQENGHR